MERVRAGQGPVPLAAAGATQRRHKTGIASSPGPFGGRQAEPAPTGCRSAGPTPTCCRRIAHESVGHRLEPPDSSRTEDSEACAPQKGRNPTACFTGAEFGGFNLWPLDSSIESATATGCRLSLPTCIAKAPFGASPTPRPRQLFAANLVVQLEPPRLLPTTKNWPDRNVSISGRPHGTAFERVRAGQCPVPLATAEAKQGRHKTRIASSPGSAGPTATCCRRY